MTCREVADFLMTYLDGELPDRQRVAFEGHLSTCPECVAYLQSYRQAVQLGKGAFADPDAPAPTEVPEELVQAILRARRAKG